MLFEDTSSMGSFMLPGMSSPEQATNSCCRVVRFDNECVLIPKSSLSRSKMPVVLTKSYSLPLWKRKTTQFSDSDPEDPAGSSAQPSSEDNRVTIKVPIPTFRRRSSASPTRAKSLIIPKSLPSCLVRRASTSSPSVKPIPIRRPSLPIYHRRQDELTIPLRDCCADCQRITEECLKEGNDWKEKFSRGARRRRSVSLEYNDKPASSSSSSHTTTRNPNNINGAFSSTEGSPSTPTRFATTAAFTITVDEVDKRRRSFDYSLDDTDLIRTSSSHPSASPFASSSGGSLYPRVKPRETSSSSTVSSSASTIDESPSGPDTLDSRNTNRLLRSSPIEEEDETQLFPLPRYSRSNTPSPSPSPSPSLIPKEVSLPVRIPSSPTTSNWKSSSSEENIVLRDSITRKVKEHLISSTTHAKSGAIDATCSLSSPSSLSLQLPITMETPTARSVSPEPSDSDTKPISEIPSSSSSSSSSQNANEIPDKNTPSSLLLLLVPPSSSNFSSSIDSSTSISSKLETTSTAVTTTTTTNHKSTPSSNNNNNNAIISNHIPPPPPSSPPSSLVPKPSQHQQKRRISFTLPFIKAGEAIRDVGVDVLKGVSSISGSGGLVGSL